MEIRNNLIARVDINSISKSKKLHQFIRQQHQSYKQLADTINKDQTDEKDGFINTITNTKFTLTDEELLILSDSTTKYYIEQCSIKPQKNSKFFIPLIETVNELSNPKLIYTVENGIHYIGGGEYNIEFVNVDCVAGSYTEDAKPELL